MKKKKFKEATAHRAGCLCWECYAGSDRRETDIPVVPEKPGFGAGHFKALEALNTSSE